MYHHICSVCKNQFTSDNKIKRNYCSYYCGNEIKINSYFLKKEYWEAIEKEYWDSVIKKENCWIWKKRTLRKYGWMKGFGGYMGAHRISWIIHNGKIPNRIHVLHKCDNPPCTNPEHLFLGTHQDNMRDMKEKKRAGKRKNCSIRI